MSANTLERRVRDRRFEPLRRGVYRIAGTPATWEQGMLAVCLSAGLDACASFHAAAALYGLEGFERTQFEITYFGRSPSPIEDVIVHETEVFDPAHIARVRGVPATSPARTLCDLTAVVQPWMVERAVDESLRRKLVQLDQIQAAAELLDGPGRRRSTVMRAILQRRQPGFEPGESEPERRIAELLVRAGLPEPVRQHPVVAGTRRFRIDLCYPRQRVAIEYDSWQYHSGRRSFDEDRARANQLVALGFTVLHFTSASSDQTIVDTVSAAIARATAS
jgi:hypothetical protein